MNDWNDVKLHTVLIADFQDRSGWQGGARNQGSYGGGPAAMSRYTSAQSDPWQSNQQRRGGYNNRNSYGGSGSYGGGEEIKFLVLKYS